MVFSCRLNQILLLKVWFWAILVLVLGAAAALFIHEWIYFTVGLVISVLILIFFIHVIVFPPKLEVHVDVLKKKEFRFFGLSVSEESVPFSKIALTKLDEGLIFSGIVVETSGGERDLLFRELKRRDARKAMNIIEEQRTKDSSV